MTARVAFDISDLSGARPASADLLPTGLAPVALPPPAQFAGVVELVKSVFRVPAVSVVLHGAGSECERGVYRSFLETPLLREGRTVGMLRVLDTAERTFDERDCILLDGFARLVVEQLDLWAEASRDVLTGAMTRRAFHDTLRKSAAAQARSRAPAALVLLDLDHFKRVNDTLGHAAGDAVLRAAARTVLAELRVEDSLGRVGGEEFAILLGGAGIEAAAEVAERVRRAIEAMDIPGVPGLRITASFGLAPLQANGEGPDAAYDAADAALYAAKRGGRNRVERAVASELPLPLAG